MKFWILIITFTLSVTPVFASEYIGTLETGVSTSNTQNTTTQSGAGAVIPVKNEKKEEVKKIVNTKADITGDGKVNIQDFVTLMAQWGKKGEKGDANGDSLVNISDFVILMANWGK